MSQGEIIPMDTQSVIKRVAMTCDRLESPLIRHGVGDGVEVGAIHCEFLAADLRHLIMIAQIVIARQQ